MRFLPLSGTASVWDVSAPRQPGEQLPAAFHHIVTPGYFEVMRIPILRGRVFDEGDSAGRPRVVVLGAAAAKRYFPEDQNPIGQYLRIEDEQRATWRVIGVVGDVRNLRPDLPPRPQIYVPIDQSPADTMSPVMRTSRDPLSLGAPLRVVLRRIDKDQAAMEVKSLDQVVADASAPWRVSRWLFLFFGAAAVALALVGIYSAVTYEVRQRTREIAVSIALGSLPSGIICMMVRSTAAACGVGIAVGLLLALSANRSLQSLLYRIDSLDATTFACAAAGFLVLALLSATAAAMSATHVQPAGGIQAGMITSAAAR